MPTLAAIQATAEIPADQLLDVGVRLFNPGLAKEFEDHPELAAKKGISVDIRRAEARYLPSLLRSTLESTGDWGAVRVIPPAVLVMDVMVDGTIVRSSGYELALDISVTDSAGRRWFQKRYQQQADTASYRDGPGRSRDPYQNIYAQIANDMLAYREQLPKAELVSIARVTRLRFGIDLAPASFQGCLARDKPHAGNAEYRVVRLPAAGDPVIDRTDRIRERDAAMIDTVSEYYAAFAERMAEPYTGWRRSTYDEIDAEQAANGQAVAREVLGAAAVLGGVLAPATCGGSSNCESIEGAVRAGAVAGGVIAVVSGLEQGKEARVHADSLKEITGSFQAEAAPMVVDLEGRTLRLTGTAEAQYAEWRRLLHDLYGEETGIVTDPPSTADAKSAAGPPAATAVLPPAKDPT
jgi:hypothetical protein